MSEMQGPNKLSGRVAVVAILIAAVVGVIALKERGEPGPHGDADNGGAGVIPSGGDRPLLVDFGSDTCVPCKMMDPILEELRTEYAEELKVVFIDVKMEREAAERNGIRVIPTQIFYSAEGKELFRHEGFYSKEEILEKWKEFGVDLGREDPAGPNGDATSLHRSLPGARDRERHATAAVSADREFIGTDIARLRSSADLRPKLTPRRWACIAVSLRLESAAAQRARMV